MPPRKLNDSFRKMVLPVKYRKDQETPDWYIYDKLDVIVAEGLTKSDAILTCEALNYIERAPKDNNQNKGNNLNEINA